MAQRVIDNCVVQISTFQKLKIRFFSFFIGLFVLFKRVLLALWRAETTPTESRDSPLACLVDNTIGYHSYVKLKGVKLHYVEVGSKDLPLAILLHGFPDCWLGWRHQIKVLSNYFRVVAVDLKGFGDSDKPMWRTSYKVKTVLKELHELVNTLSASKSIVIGHDLGALIGWYYVTQYPDAVDKFISISCPHPNYFWEYLPSSSIFNSRWMQLCQLPVLPELEARKDDLALIDQCHSHLVGTKEEKLTAAYKYVFSRSEDWTGPLNYFRNLPFTRIKEGCSVVVPTLLIVGNKDPCIQLEGVVRSTELAGKFLLKIVESAGHYPHQENPEFVNKLLLSFLTVPAPCLNEKSESSKGLIGSLYSNTMKYGNSLVDGVKKTTNGLNGVVWRPSQMLKQSS